jgi:thiamine biosynthesis lipoprotein
MGMEVRMVLHAPDEGIATRAATAAFATIAALDARLSDYRPDSDVRAIADAAPAPVVVVPEVLEVLTRAAEVARATHGAFDPTVSPLVELWRDARTSLMLPSDDTVARARALVGWSRVELDAVRSTVRLPEAGMHLDLGGIAKGFILQRALDTLRAEGVPHAMLEAGGDIVVGDAPPGTDGWRIAVMCAEGRAFRDVSASDDDATVVLQNAALATSGASAQFVDIDGTRYSHVVDPRTGLGLTDHVMVHVVASDGGTADAWATALSVLGPDGAATVTLPVGVRYCFAERFMAHRFQVPGAVQGSLVRGSWFTGTPPPGTPNRTDAPGTDAP